MGLINFSKGGSVKNTADTIATNDTVEVLLGLCEGPIKGPVNGSRSFYADDTALVNDNGQPNFSNFSLDYWPGDELGHDVSMVLGGFGSPFTVGQTLARNVPLTRQGTKTDFTCADFRIVVSQLVKSNDKGTFTETLRLKFEYKKISDPTWHAAFSGDPAPVNDFYGDYKDGLLVGSSDATSSTDGLAANWAYVKGTTASSFEADKDVQTTTGTPSTTPTYESIAHDPTAGVIYHWDTGDSVWSAAQSTVSAGAYYATFLDGTTTRRIYNPSNTTPPADARTGDIWQRGIGDYVIWNGSAWVLPNQYTSLASTQRFLSNGVFSYTGKISSATPMNIRVFLAASTEPYEYRVTLLDPTTNTEIFCDVAWESLNEIKQTDWHFDGLAMLRVVAQASDQFTSLPTWNGIYEGRIIKVPTNYDPVTRIYTGVWDGTYKLAYTNNTAWIFQDFIENTRYGLSAIYPHSVNKWNIYEWAQWCDGMVPRADGTLQPRWTYNNVLLEPTNAEDMARYIAASAAATYVDDGNGLVEVLVDKDSQAVALFTVENVNDEGFEYSYTERLTCYNELSVGFINPDFNWQEDHRIVKSDADIATNGRIEDDFIAVGCIDVDEALRRGRRRLIQGMTERESVTFATNRKGRFLKVWHKILIADKAQGRALSGRIREKTGVRTVSLRDPLNLEVGFTYYLTFDVPDGLNNTFKTFRSQVITPSGAANMSLTVANDLPTLPTMAAFSLEADGIIGIPKPYRILNIQNETGDGDNIVITAVELNVNKYAYIDQAADVEEVSYSSFDNKIVAPPTKLNVTSSLRQVGAVSSRILTLTWLPSTDQFIRRYKVYVSVNGSVATLTETTDSTIEFDGSAVGEYTFSLVAVNMMGRESLPVTFKYDLQGVQKPVATPANLRLVGGITSTTFDGLDASFAFDPVSTANLKGYEVKILNASTNAVLRTVDLGLATIYTYDFGSNKTDGLRRTFKISVQAYDQDGNYSPATVLQVSNPAPAVPGLTVKPSPRGFSVILAPVTDRDVAGAMVWVGTTAGFDPVVLAPEVDGDQSSFFISYAGEGPRYIRAAYYDKFGKAVADLNISSEVIDQIIPLNADVLGGIPAATIISNITTAQSDALFANLSVQALRIVETANTYDGDGVSAVTKAREALIISTQAIERVESFATVLPGGTAALLNVDYLMVDGTTSIAQKFSSLTNIVGANEANVTSMMEVVDGLDAKVTITTDVNGIVGGLTLGSTPLGSYFGVYANKFALADPGNANNIVYPFIYAGGVITMNALVVINGDLIVQGTITNAQLAANAALLMGEAFSAATVTGNGTWKTLVSTNVNMPAAGRISAICTAQQTFNSPHAWTFELYIDSILCADPQGTAYADAPAMSGQKLVGAGSIPILLRWKGDAGVDVTQSQINWFAGPKTT